MKLRTAKAVFVSFCAVGAAFTGWGATQLVSSHKKQAEAERQLFKSTLTEAESKRYNRIYVKATLYDEPSGAEKAAVGALLVACGTMFWYVRKERMRGPRLVKKPSLG